jgi:hypothetical protein
MSQMDKQAIILAILLMAVTIFCAIQTQTATAQVDPTIHILSNGTVTPATTPIKQNGTTYKVTANLNTTMVVERNNIVLDGQGFTIQGAGQANGQTAINMTCTGVTVKNFHIEDWQVGVLGAYDNNKIVGNEFTNNFYDIAVYGKNYEIKQNHLGYVRIQASNIHVTENEFHTRKYGSAFWISNSSNITIEANEFLFTSDTTSFISIDSNSDIQVFHNNFFSKLLESKGQSYYFGIGGISDLEPWDNGFPSGGNYWRDFSVIYGNASMIDDSGIWDTAHVISERMNLVDRYPLYNPYDIDIAPLPTPPPSQTPEVSPTPSVSEIPIWTFLLVITAGFVVTILKRKVLGRPMGSVCA